MPETRVIFYQDEKGKVPVLDWLDELERQQLFVADPATHTYEEEQTNGEN